MGAIKKLNCAANCLTRSVKGNAKLMSFFVVESTLVHVYGLENNIKVVVFRWIENIMLFLCWCNSALFFHRSKSIFF